MDTRQDDNHDWLDGETYIPEGPAISAAPVPILATPRHIPARVLAQSKRSAPQSPIATAPLTPSSPQASSPPMPHKSRPAHFPGFIARSAMFRVTRQNKILPQLTQISIAGGSMSICGPLLCMRDKAVWETAIQIAKERANNVGEAFDIELRDFARRMGSSDHSGKALDSIWASLERLAQVRVEFEIIKEKCKGIGSLLASAIKTGGRAYVRLNPDFALAALVGGKQFRFNTARRNALPSSLAQWLHDYYTTHKIAEEVDLKYLRGLCGYDGVARNFPTKLREAMDELTNAAPSLIESYSVIDTTRSSDAWKLLVVFGSETPEFLPPGRVPTVVAAKSNGGVSL